MLKRLFLLCALMLPLLMTGTPAMADVFRSGEFSLQPDEDPAAYELIARIPQAADNSQPIILPEGCLQHSAMRQPAGGDVMYAFGISCESELRPGDAIITPWPVDGASFTTNLSGQPFRQTIVGADGGVPLTIAAQDAAPRALPQVAAEYGWQGILHIWMGWDHLAFVLCLCLIAKGRQLIILVTAFTLGHSLSLGLAFFDVIYVPIMPVEAIIALSIAFMAREALLAARAEPGSSDRSRRYITVVSLFGLLHGLGFASALDELGVVEGEKVAGLVFFNVGVETGQLIFVAAITALMWMLRNRPVLRPMQTAALYGVGALGAFWLVERVSGFTGII